MDERKLLQTGPFVHLYSQWLGKAGPQWDAFCMPCVTRTSQPPCPNGVLGELTENQLQRTTKAQESRGTPELAASIRTTYRMRTLNI